MSENYVEKKKNTLQKEFYDKLNEYWAGESRLMYSEEYGSTSYVPMDMDAVRFIDNRDEKDVTFDKTTDELDGTLDDARLEIFAKCMLVKINI